MSEAAAAVKSDAILARLLTLHPKVIDLALDRILALLDALGRPQDKLPPVVHIAGTNGKGIDDRLSPRNSRSRRLCGARLHLTASHSLQRTHQACGQADRRGSVGECARPLRTR